jgi:hypothetical protein
MSGVADIQRAIWEEEDFSELDPDAKLLFIWAFSNERCNLAGLYKVRQKAMEVDTGLTPARTAAALHECEEQRFVSYVDGVLFVRSFVKRMRQRGINQAKGIANCVKALSPEHPQRRAWLDKYTVPGYEWLQGIDKKNDVCLHLIDDLVENTIYPLGEKGPGSPSEGASEGPDRGSEGVSETASTSDPSPSGGRAFETPSKGSMGRGRGVGRAHDKEGASDKEALPDNFPTELVPVLDSVVSRLERMTAERGGLPVKRVAVAAILAKYPLRKHVEIADKLGHWLLHGNGQNRRSLDAVARYRDWVAGEPDVLPTPKRGQGPRAQARAKAEAA